MKIGILTFHRADNYGAVLQNYALVESLKKLNQEVYTIDFRTDVIEKQYNVKVFPKSTKNIVKWIYKLIISLLTYNKHRTRKESFNTFRDKNINMTKSYYSSEMTEELLGFDAYITGSDQVWNEKIIKDENIEIYTLGFVNNFPKISYAASAGSCQYISAKMIEYISKLSSILVREKELKEFLIEKQSNQVKVVMDPVFLLSQELWKSKLSNENKSKNYILLYFIDSNINSTIKIAKDIAKLRSKKIIYPVDYNKKLLFNGKCALEKGPFEFIELIQNADFVVASSFHAVAFSIIFEKNFIVIPHEKTGRRILDLLTNLGLSQRIVLSYEDYLKKKDSLNNIDYTLIRKKIDCLRSDSLESLKKALNI